MKADDDMGVVGGCFFSTTCCSAAADTCEVVQLWSVPGGDKLREVVGSTVASASSSA